MVPEIRTLVGVYRLFYRERRRCVCTEGNEYPNLFDSDGNPVICQAHEWEHQWSLMKSLLVKRGISLPIPKKDNPSEQFKAFKADTLKKFGSIYKNPVKRDREIAVHNMSPGEKDQGDTIAVSIAHWLDQVLWDADTREMFGQHIVVYLDRSTVISQTFSGNEDCVRDALTYAPILVYWQNTDGRNASWIMNAIRVRQYGLAFIVE